MISYLDPTWPDQMLELMQQHESEQPAPKPRLRSGSHWRSIHTMRECIVLMDRDPQVVIRFVNDDDYSYRNKEDFLRLYAPM